jgi:hypothetical protein
MNTKKIIETLETQTDSIFTHAFRIENALHGVEESSGTTRSEHTKVIRESLEAVQTAAGLLENKIEELTGADIETDRPDARMVAMWLEDLDKLNHAGFGHEVQLTLNQLSEHLTHWSIE